MNKNEVSVLPSWYENALQRVDTRISQSVKQRTDSLSAPSDYWTLSVDWHDSDGFTSSYEGRLRAGGRLMTTIRGECLQFWHAWLSINDKPFLLLPYLSACQVLVDCRTCEKVVILDADDSESSPFRWLSVTPHPSGNPIIAVEGRYDGSPCRIKILDFKDAQNPRCLRFLDAWYSEFHGWMSDTTLRIVRNIEVRVRDNKRLEDMSDEEVEQMETTGDLTQDVDEGIEVDVSEVLSPTWNSDDRSPLILADRKEAYEPK
jgi:hypothetical protein